MESYMVCVQELKVKCLNFEKIQAAALLHVGK